MRILPLPTTRLHRIRVGTTAVLYSGSVWLLPLRAGVAPPLSATLGVGNARDSEKDLPRSRARGRTQDVSAASTGFATNTAASNASGVVSSRKLSDDSVVWHELRSNDGDLRGKLPELLKARMDTARAQGRTLFVEVGATWCEPCLELERNLTKPEFIDAFAGTSIVHLDANEWDVEDDMAPLGIKGKLIPLIVALDPQSPKAIAQLNGVIDAAGIKKFLSAHRWPLGVGKSDTSTAGMSKPMPFRSGSRAAAPIPGAPHGVTAFVDVGVVPMDRDTVLLDQTVLVAGGRVTALGPARQVHVPAGAVRIDGRGNFLLPGLADMHVHIHQGPHIGDAITRNQFTELSVPEADSAQEVQRLFLWLANGVTTIRNVDYAEDDSSRRVGRLALQFRARAATGREWIPHMYTAGQWGSGADIGHPGRYASSSLADSNSVAAHVAAYKAAGYDFIKIHDEAPQTLDSVLTAAKQIGLPVIGHVPRPTEVEHILSGYHCIEHPVNDYARNGTDERAPLDTTGIRQLAAAMARNGVWSDPTQSHYDRLHYIPPSGELGFVHPPDVLKILQDSGVKLLTGTDETPWIGVLTRELEEFVNSGLTPYQALRASTWNVAEYFGTLNARGSIAVGKEADLVLLTGNPLQDIHYTARPSGVMLGGRWLSRAAIDARLATMRFPTVTNNQVVIAPVKSYWHNVADMMWLTVQEFLAFPYEPVDETQYASQWQALADSLDRGDQYAVGTQRMVTLFARQISRIRPLVADDENLRQPFDALAHTWVERYHNGGYTVPIK